MNRSIWILPEISGFSMRQMVSARGLKWGWTNPEELSFEHPDGVMNTNASYHKWSLAYGASQTSFLLLLKIEDHIYF